MTTPVLALHDVHAAYGKIEVLHGVELTVPPSSVVALLGPNGGGKTTTLKVASGSWCGFGDVGGCNVAAADE